MSARTLLLGVSTLLLACGGSVAVPDAGADAAAVYDAGSMLYLYASIRRN